MFVTFVLGRGSVIVPISPNGMRWVGSVHMLCHTLVGSSFVVERGMQLYLNTASIIANFRRDGAYLEYDIEHLSAVIMVWLRLSAVPFIFG